jgi:uncharacterized membrane protein YhhN
MILPIFFVLTLAHLIAAALDVSWAEWATKPLLMPLLAAYVLSRRGPRPVVAALLLSAAGDIALQFDGGTNLFLLGMVFFAAAHVCYVTFFLQGGGVQRLLARWWIPAAYLVIWLTLIMVLWPGLGALAAPVAVYSLLLISTGATSAAYGLRAGLGGALFVLSDALIALRLADLPQPPGPDIWVMLTYAAAQYLLATAVTQSAEDQRRVTEPRRMWPDDRSIAHFVRRAQRSVIKK